VFFCSLTLNSAKIAILSLKMQKKELKNKKFNYLDHLYLSWLAALMALIIITVLDRFLIDWGDHPQGLADYQNAAYNIILRFPLAITIVTTFTIFLVLKIFQKEKLKRKILLIFLNLLTLGIGLLAFMFSFQELIRFKISFLILEVLVLLIFLARFIYKKR